MRRLWFKKEMKAQILAGKKETTTRTHPLKLEDYQAVSGSRYKSQVFAILRIESSIDTTWDRVINARYSDEGFKSPAEMTLYLKKNHLMKSLDEKVYFHRFEVVKSSAK